MLLEMIFDIGRSNARESSENALNGNASGGLDGLRRRAAQRKREEGGTRKSEKGKGKQKTGQLDDDDDSGRSFADFQTRLRAELAHTPNPYLETPTLTFRPSFLSSSSSIPPISLSIPFDNSSAASIEARNVHSIAISSQPRIVDALKSRFIHLDADALDESGALSEGTPDAAPIGEEFISELHDRTLLSLIDTMPYELGRELVLPLQDLFRKGYKARDDWRAREKKRAEQRAMDVESGQAIAGGIYEMELFDDETLGGHVTFDKFNSVLGRRILYGQ